MIAGADAAFGFAERLDEMCQRQTKVFVSVVLSTRTATDPADRLAGHVEHVDAIIGQLTAAIIPEPVPIVMEAVRVKGPQGGRPGR